MAQVSYGSITVSDLTDITDVYLEYAKIVDTIKRDQDIPNDTIWDKTYPKWESGYQIWIRQVTKKEGLPDKYGTPYLDTAVNQINNRISIEEIEREALASRLKKIWVNLNPTNTYPAGTYAAAGIDNKDVIENDSSTYGFNTFLSHEALRLRYNNVNLTELKTTSLTFYRPKQGTTKVETEDTAIVPGKKYYIYDEDTEEYILVDDLQNQTPVDEGWFEDKESLVQGNKGLKLDADSLILYKPDEAVAATLSSKGLDIADGSLILGEQGSDDYVHLSTRNLDSELIINKEPRTDWRLILGNKFGVTKSGYLSTSEGIIGGWEIDSTAIRSNKREKWDTNVDGIYIGNYINESNKKIFTIAGGKLQYVPTENTEFSEETTYYEKTKVKTTDLSLDGYKDYFRLIDPIEKKYEQVTGDELYQKSQDEIVIEDKNYYQKIEVETEGSTKNYRYERIINADSSANPKGNEWYEEVVPKDKNWYEDGYVEIENTAETRALNPAGKGWYENIGPMWYINSDGSASFGSLLVNRYGSLDVPAASITGTLTAAQIKVNDLGAISANIGATVEEGGLSGTLIVNSKYEFTTTLDSRKVPGKIYYIFDGKEYVIINTEGEAPNSLYKKTRDESLIWMDQNAATPYKDKENIFSEEILESSYQIVSDIKEHISEYIESGLKINSWNSEYREDVLELTELEATGIITYGGSGSDSKDPYVIESTLNFTFVSIASEVTAIFNTESGTKEETITIIKESGAEEKLEVPGGFYINIEPNQDFFKGIYENISADYYNNIEIYIDVNYLTVPHIKQYYVKTKGKNEFTPLEYFTLTNHEIPSVDPRTYSHGEDYDNGLYESEIWYEKINSSYLTLESNKIVYVLSDDTEIKKGTNYYEYVTFYSLTLDTVAKENKDYFKPVYHEGSSTPDFQIIPAGSDLLLDKDPSKEELYEKTSSYRKVEIEGEDNRSPKGENWYIAKDIDNINLTLQDANLSLRSNEKEVFSVQSDDKAQVGISKAKIFDSLILGELEIFSFNNGIAIRTIDDSKQE